MKINLKKILKLGGLFALTNIFAANAQEVKILSSDNANKMPKILVEKSNKHIKIQPPSSESLKLIYDDLSQKYSKNMKNNAYLIISVKNQRMYLVNKDKILQEFVISTAKNGIGNEINSFQTPLGAHVIHSKIGDNAPLNTVFKDRKNTNKISTILKNENEIDKEDGITTRVMPLMGLEEGINKGEIEKTIDGVSKKILIDSYKRDIYIHGTREEGNLGKPASLGCIRMYNADVAILFSLVKSGKNGTLVLIQE